MPGEQREHEGSDISGATHHCHMCHVVTSAALSCGGEPAVMAVLWGIGSSFPRNDALK
jgi:hypothetical protein